MHTVASIKWQKLRMQLTMRNVVDESSPVEIESISRTLAGPTTISPGWMIPTRWVLIEVLKWDK